MGQLARHPRVSLSGLCFPKLSAVEGVAAVAELGVKVVTTTALARFDLRPGADNEASRKLAVADIDRAAAVGVTASALTCSTPGSRADCARRSPRIST